MKSKGKPKNPPSTEERSIITTMSAAGASISKIAKHVVRSRQMVRNVLAEPEVKTAIQDEKAELAVLHRGRARDCLVAIDADKIEKSSALQLATASGILLDKAQPLDGQPTSINLNVLADLAEQLRAIQDKRNVKQI